MASWAVAWGSVVPSRATSSSFLLADTLTSLVPRPLQLFTRLSSLIFSSYHILTGTPTLVPHPGTWVSEPWSHPHGCTQTSAHAPRRDSPSPRKKSERNWIRRQGRLCSSQAGHGQTSATTRKLFTLNQLLLPLSICFLIWSSPKHTDHSFPLVCVLPKASLNKYTPILKCLCLHRIQNLTLSLLSICNILQISP